MCVVSMIGDGYTGGWPNSPFNPQKEPLETWIKNAKPISREEFDKLKKEVEELKKLLTVAKKFDEETNQKDCHMDEKVRLLKELANLVGVDLKEVFEKE